MRFTLSPLLALVLCAFAPTAWAVINPADRIVLTDLGPGVYPTAVNNVGQVAGQAADGVAFRWQNGTFTSLGTLGGAQSYANDLNDSGVVVGWSHDAAGKMKSFRYDWVPNTLQNLDSATALEGAAEGINSEGKVVGWRTNGNAVRSVLWNPNNASVDTGVVILGSSFNHKLLSINDEGHAVGLKLTAELEPLDGFYWEGDDISTITEVLDLNYFPYAGINNNDLTAGVEGGAQYYLLAEGRSFGIPWLAPSDLTAGALGLNDLDIIVGESGSKGFLYELSTDEIHNINSFALLGAAFDSIITLTDINNSNAFVGIGLIDGVPHGLYGEFVAVPEPRSIALALATLFAAPIKRRRPLRPHSTNPLN